MNNNGSILPSPLSAVPHVWALDYVAKEALGDVPTMKLLLLFLDTVDAQALPYLAELFDVAGAKGYAYAITEADKRQLLKDSIELHRVKGSVWAVKKSLEQAGYASGVLTEGSGGHWANFRVTVPFGTFPIDYEQIATGARLVNEYKPARSHFEGFYYSGLNFSDDSTLADGTLTSSSGTLFADGMSTGAAPFAYNGAQPYNGLHNYNQDTDVITINIV